LKNGFTKISLFILIGLFISSCSSIKKVPNGKKLLVKNDVIVNGTLSKSEDVNNLIYQKPNTTLLGYRFRLNLYNMALQNPDSVYKSKFINNLGKYERKSKWLSKKQVDRLGKSFYYFGIHEILKKNGEAPVLFDETKSEKSLLRINFYYQNLGFFDVKSTFKTDSVGLKKTKTKYTITTGLPFMNDTINIKIQSLVLDSIYESKKSKSFLKKQQYKIEDLQNERNRITKDFRNNGIYDFQSNFVNYTIDTIQTNKKVNLTLLINDRDKKLNDSLISEPFKMYKISKINIFTDSKSKTKTQDRDSVFYKNVSLYGTGKLKFRPRAITNAVFITKNSLYSDDNTILTSKYLGNLGAFNYPNIQYVVDKKDTISNSLIANIYLSQRKKYQFHLNTDFTHSNIQLFGISAGGSLSIRNIFRGAETFEIGGRGNLGASQDLANPDNRFFNISEFGLDSKLTFPSILLPFRTDRIIPKTMIPSTNITIGFAKQRNIGLDKENFTASLIYNWTPKKNTSMRLDLLNIQFVKNINTGNYFNVYRSSYRSLNNFAKNYAASSNYFDSNNDLLIESGTNSFLENVLSATPTIFPTADDFRSIRSINERKIRLTENDLIVSSGITFTKTTKTDLLDNYFYTLKAKFESAGNLISLFAKNPKNKVDPNAANSVFGVNYSQYLKFEIDFVKHWDLSGKKVLAIRAFAGIAIPYGNSKDIPFSRSYFAGGSNDNRAWQPYSLGPGRSGARNDFNEANLKLVFSTELRFNIFNKTNGAIFADVGNIWNIFDGVEDENSKFTGIKSLGDIAIGSGFGFRQDFNFFVVRLDFGFKTYNPSFTTNQKWFRDYNFANTVLNIGINYPF
jgi:outer membrane protein assembly factor BamA